MKKRFEDWLTWLIGGFAAVVLLYFVTAPPILNALIRARGQFSYPAIYAPIVNIIQSDYGGPLLWYFNDVWHSGIILFGEETGPSWPMIILYLVSGIAMLSIAVFPFLRRWRKNSRSL